jgi:hypothetical protein
VSHYRLTTIERDREGKLTERPGLPYEWWPDEESARADLKIILPWMIAEASTREAVIIETRIESEEV